MAHIPGPVEDPPPGLEIGAPEPGAVGGDDAGTHVAGCRSQHRRLQPAGGKPMEIEDGRTARIAVAPIAEAPSVRQGDLPLRFHGMGNQGRGTWGCDGGPCYSMNGLGVPWRTVMAALRRRSAASGGSWRCHSS